MSDYKLAIKIAGELDGTLQSAVAQAQGYVNQLNGGGIGGTGGMILSGIASGAKALAAASLSSLGLITAGAGAVTKSAIDAGMSFEDAMATLAGTAGINRSSEAYTQLSEAAQHVGETTNKSATEAAAALQYMALAGWSTEDSIASLEDMVKLSSAAEMDLGRTSDLVTDSMGALGLSMDDYAGYMDMVARADSAANYSAGEFMETMIGAGGSARLLGIDVAELGTAAGILANNGTKGTEAGTKLNSIFARMAGQTKPVQDALAALGTTITDDAGNFLSMEDMFSNIKTGLSNITDEAQRAQIMKDLFGTHNLSEAQYLIDSIGENGAWDSLEQNLTNAQNGIDEAGNAFDTLNERYNTATDTLTGDLDIMKSQWQSFGIDIYNAIVGGDGTGLRGAVTEATNIISELHEAFNTDGFSGLATNIGTQIGKVSSAIQTRGGAAISRAQQFASELITSLGSEGNAESIGGAAATIISGLAEGFLTYTGDFAVAAGNIIDGLVQGLNAEDTGARIGEAGGAMIQKIGTWFAENGTEFGTAAGNLISSLATGLTAHAGEIISGGIDIVAGLASGLIAGAGVLVGQAPQIIGDLVMGILNSVPRLVEAGKALILALKDGLISAGQGFGEFFTELITPDDVSVSLDGDWMTVYADNAESINSSIAQAATEGAYGYQEMSDGARAYFDQLSSGQTTLQEMQDQASTMAAAGGDPLELGDMNTAMEAFALAAQQMAEEGAAANESMVESVSETSSGISEATQAAIDAATAEGEGVSAASEAITQGLNELKAEAATTATEVQSSLDIDLADSMGADALSVLFNSIDAGNIDQVVGQLNSAMSTVQVSVANATGSVKTNFQSMASVVSSSCSSAAASASSAASSISGAFSGIDLGGIASNMMAGLTNGIQAGGNAAIAAAQAIANAISAAMSTALKINSPSKVTYGIGLSIGEGLENAMYDGQKGVHDAAGSLAGNVTSGTNDALSRSMTDLRRTDVPGAVASAAGGDGAGGIVFSPQITIAGSASEGDVRKALSWSMAEFEKMYDRLQSKRRRTAFA